MPSPRPCPACGHSESLPRRVGQYEIYRCAGCGLGFLGTPADPAAAVDYDNLYTPSGDYHAHVSEVKDLQAGARNRFSRAREQAITELAAAKPGRLLEVGCGVGNFLAVVEPMGIECYGTDVSGNAIRLAATHLKSRLFNGIFTRETFPGVQFDVACSWEVLEHIDDVVPFLSVIFDRLCAGGTLYLSTPNYQSHWMWRDIPNDPRGQPPVHVTYWTKPSLERVLRRVGFGDVSVRRYSVPLNAAVRAVGAAARPLVYADALLRPSQRRTLLARATRPGDGRG